MTALLLLACLASAAAPTSGPRAQPRLPAQLRPAPFMVTATFPRLIAVTDLLPGPVAPSVVPKLLPSGVYVLPERAAAVQLQAAVPGDAAAPAPSGEAAAAQAGAAFDGSGGPPAVPGDAVAQSGLPPYLSVPNEADRGWIADVVNVALGTKTGARVLAGIEKLAAEQKRPLTIVVTALRTNNGEYVYDWDVVRMNSAYRKLDPFSAAPIFMHELLHVLQKVEGYPVEALDLELEAFLITLRMHQELNLPPKRGSFEAGAARALAKSAEAYVKYVADSYGGNRQLGQGGIRGYVAWLKKDAARYRRAIARLEKDIAKERAVLEAMRAGGQPEEHAAAYERDVVNALERQLLEKYTALAWDERDLSLLGSPEGAARYRAYARRVRRMARQAAGPGKLGDKARGR